MHDVTCMRSPLQDVERKVEREHGEVGADGVQRGIGEWKVAGCCGRPPPGSAGSGAARMQAVLGGVNNISSVMMTRLTSLVMEASMRVWALQDAKARLSEVVRLAMEHEPQEITLRGEPAVVVLSVEDYRRLVHPKPSFVDLIRNSPLMDVDIDLTREQTLTREIDP
ncbi:type II toxin-antitoxin system Phd/YefM family antitoxin [Candidatus Methylocalor cossyra]